MKPGSLPSKMAAHAYNVNAVPELVAVERSHAAVNAHHLAKPIKERCAAGIARQLCRRSEAKNERLAGDLDDHGLNRSLPGIEPVING